MKTLTAVYEEFTRIFGIKQKPNIEKILKNSKFNDFRTPVVRTLELYLNDTWNSFEDLVGNDIKGKPLVDLACGEPDSVAVMYALAARLGASEYIGVNFQTNPSPHELYDSLIGVFIASLEQKERKRVYNSYEHAINASLEQQITPIEWRIVDTDMLSFLTGQKQKANFSMNGVDYAIIDHRTTNIIYMDMVFSRVSELLPDNGILFGWQSEPWIEYAKPHSIKDYNTRNPMGPTGYSMTHVQHDLFNNSLVSKNLVILKKS